MIRFIGSGDITEGDGKAVPGINHDDVDRQLDEFLICELLACLRVNIIGHVPLGDQGHRLGESQRSAFAVRVKRCFAPGIEGVQALFSFAA